MSNKENVIVWGDNVAKIDCPRCGEMIGSMSVDGNGNVIPQPRLRGLIYSKCHRFILPKGDRIEKSDNAVFVHEISGKCVNCNLPVTAYYFPLVSDSPKKKGADLAKKHYPSQCVQRWREQQLTLRCECGALIGSIDTMDKETIRKRRFYRPEYKPGYGRRVGLRARISSHDRMVWKENLEHFLPVKDRVISDWLQEMRDEHGLDVYDFYDPLEHDNTPYKPSMPEEIAMHYLALRLKFHSTFQDAACRVGWSRSELTVAGACFQCSVFHTFSPEYREDFLVRCVEVLEERRKRTNKP